MVGEEEEKEEEGEGEAGWEEDERRGWRERMREAGGGVGPWLRNLKNC